MENTTRVVEINGVKMEIDLRTAKTIENYKVGDNIKVLIKEYSDYKSYAGVIVGFDEFVTLPTIIIAYLKLEYSSAEIKFVYINAQSKDVEICASNEKEIPFEKGRVLEMMDKKITEAEVSIVDLKNKKEYFLNNFNAYFKSQTL
jgi:hypothetical protein